MEGANGRGPQPVVGYHVAPIDADLHIVGNYKWQLVKGGYIRRNSQIKVDGQRKWRAVLLHTLSSRRRSSVDGGLWTIVEIDRRSFQPAVEAVDST